MSPELVGIIGVVLLIVLFLLRVQVGLSMLIVGFVGYSYIVNPSAAFAVVSLVPYSTVGSYSLSVMPLFILMGMFLSYGGLGRDVFTAVDAWFRQTKGGMAIAAVGACAGFAAVSGSATATAATIGAVALPEMKKYGYSDSLSTACVAVGGTLGILIPPSTVLILYGVMTELSIGKLLMAGLVPGILLAVLLMVTIYVQVRLKPSIAPTRPAAPMKERMASLGLIWPLILIFILVMGGIYGGIFSPTEAAACGAFIALIFSIATKRFSRSAFKGSLDQTVRTSAMLFLILIGANVFGRFLAVTQIPFQLSDFIAGLEVSRYVVMAVIMLIMVFLGCFVEGLSLMVLTIPILYPLIINLGFDGVWFGPFLVVLLNIGMVTPPVGVNVFVTAGVAKNVPIMTIFRGVAPLWLGMIACAILLVAFPQIVTFLPSLMKG